MIDNSSHTLTWHDSCYCKTYARWDQRNNKKIILDFPLDLAYFESMTNQLTLDPDYIIRADQGQVIAFVWYDSAGGSIVEIVQDIDGGHLQSLTFHSCTQIKDIVGWMDDGYRDAKLVYGTRYLVHVAFPLW